MPTDLQTIADPGFIIAAWAGGLAGVAGVVAVARIVGPGFVWLTGGLAGLVALTSAVFAGAGWLWAGLVFCAAGLIWARSGLLSGAALVLAALAFGTQASALGGWILAATAALTLGGVTGEMILGHWYLVDPRLSRAALRVLAYAGILGLVADGVALTLTGSLSSGRAAIIFWVLLGSSIALMAGVVGALRYPAYSGVMAATGLSYLAVLTTLGAVFLGRALVAGLEPFAI